MVSVLYTEFFRELDEFQFMRLLDRIPYPLRNKILKFQRWEDRYASLFGKLLLQKGLTWLGISDVKLEDIQYTEYKKPYFNRQVDFNISHTKNCVTCVLSKDYKVGIDIEEIHPIEVKYFKEQWNADEWKEISSSLPSLDLFYSFWTRKESVIKANGKGMSIPLKSINVRNSVVTLEDVTWYLKRIPLVDNHMVHIATDKKLKKDHDLVIKKVQFYDDCYNASNILY